MAVYKASGKDGRGAWFARRSVHEGLGFQKWKLGLQREFPETVEIKTSPGDGNIRGIGGERRVERVGVDGVGTMEVYHLSAQFPGPTTPRDFVTLLLTSSNALSEPGMEKLRDAPRHFMVVSRPCIHPGCPPRDGFIRGQYESVEFIREVPRKPIKSASTIDLGSAGREHVQSSLEEEALIRRATHVDNGGTETLSNGEHLSPTAAGEIVREGRKRGKTISFAGSRGVSAKGEKMDTPQPEDDAESNPVEWIMITRSDPGGSVPRFMVERGTPSSIVADASKFLDWACKKDHGEDETEALNKGDVGHLQQKPREDLKASETNGHLAGLDGSTDKREPPRRHASLEITGISELQLQESSKVLSPLQSQHQSGLLSSVANVAYTSIESYAPQAVIDRLPSHQQTPSMSTSTTNTISEPTLSNGSKELARSVSIASESSFASFASAEDHFDDADSICSTTKSPSKAPSSLSPHEKELEKLTARKQQLDEKLAKAREKETKDKEDLTSREVERVRKMEEKHAKEVQKQEERYKKEVAKLEAKQRKEETKMEERKRKEADKDEKARLSRQLDELQQQLDVANKEKGIFRDQIGALQRENTILVARLGKMEEGKDLLREVKADMEGNRSRSSSLRRGKGAPEKGKEATIVGGEKEVLEAVKSG